jgi:hypothetical protein
MMARRKRKQIEAIAEIVPPTPEQIAKGASPGFVVHVESWTMAKAYRTNNSLDQWRGSKGFHDGTFAAIEWCQARWEARGHIGKLCATYEPTVGAGGGNVARDVELRDELDKMKALFPPSYWDVFENVCRWGQPAGVACSEWANNSPQAIAQAKAIVGMVANIIAMKQGM